MRNCYHARQHVHLVRTQPKCGFETRSQFSLLLILAAPNSRCCRRCRPSWIKPRWRHWCKALWNNRRASTVQRKPRREHTPAQLAPRRKQTSLPHRWATRLPLKPQSCRCEFLQCTYDSQSSVHVTLVMTDTTVGPNMIRRRKLHPNKLPFFGVFTPKYK